VGSVQRFGFHAQPTSLVLTFNGSLDPVRAETASNYQIIGPGGRVVAISSATYDSVAHTVTLAPQQQLNLHQSYQLTVVGTGSGGINDTAGRLLDGAGTGHSGSDYHTVVTAANMVFGSAVPGGPSRLARLRKAVARMAEHELAALTAQRTAGRIVPAAPHRP
jgi:hypothetical protein